MSIRGHITFICLVCIVVQCTTITACQSTIKRSADVDEEESASLEVLAEVKTALNTISKDLQLLKESTNAQQQNVGQKLEEIERKLREMNETNQYRLRSTVHHLTTYCSPKRLDSSESIL
jgi:SpoU rRNA methylase family enzyme